MDEDHEESKTSGEDAGSVDSNDGSNPGSDCISSSEESNDDSNEGLSGGSLAPYSFEPSVSSDSDRASALLDDDDSDSARDERLYSLLPIPSALRKWDKCTNTGVRLDLIMHL